MYSDYEETLSDIDGDNDPFDGYNKLGYSYETGLNDEGYDYEGYDEEGYDEDGFDIEGYDKDGYDEHGFDEDGIDMDGHDRDGLGLSDDSDGGSTTNLPRMKKRSNVKKSNPNSKSESAKQQEKAAIAAFDAQKQAVEARAAEGDGDVITVQLLKPTSHLTINCWSAFSKHVKISPGWKAKRRVATPEEKAAYQMGSRYGKVYFVDVIYKPKKEPKPKKKRAAPAMKEKKEKKKTEKSTAISKQKKMMETDGVDASTAIDLHDEADDEESPKKKKKLSKKPVHIEMNANGNQICTM